jgi:hypothetical protein
MGVPRSVPPSRIFSGGASSRGRRTSRGEPSRRGPIPTSRAAEPRPRAPARYGRARVLERLRKGAGTAAFEKAREDLGVLCGSKTGDDREETGGYRVHVRSGTAVDLVRIQEDFLARGAFVFATERNLGTGAPERLVLLPTTDPYEAVAIVGTSAPNYGHDTAAVIGCSSGWRRSNRSA